MSDKQALPKKAVPPSVSSRPAHARNNRYTIPLYLAPAAGLTVEEAEQIAVDARIELDEIEWKSPPISYEKEFRRILKHRLAAALNAKRTAPNEQQT